MTFLHVSPIALLHFLSLALLSVPPTWKSCCHPVNIADPSEWCSKTKSRLQIRFQQHSLARLKPGACLRCLADEVQACWQWPYTVAPSSKGFPLPTAQHRSMLSCTYACLMGQVCNLQRPCASSDHDLQHLHVQGVHGTPSLWTMCLASCCALMLFLEMPKRAWGSWLWY